MNRVVYLVKSDVAAGATNTLRPLTQPSDLTRTGGLAVDATPVEEWRPVVGFEGSFEVSNKGRVRSVDRIVHVREGHDGTPAYARRVKGIPRKLNINPHDGGYVYVSLNAAGRRRSAKVHHLVLEAFVGPRPEGLECCHGNGDPTDNRLENLRWDTFEANVADRVAGGKGRKTYCPKKHEYTSENTITRLDPKTGREKRACRACARDNSRRQNQRLSELRRTNPEWAEERRRYDRERARRIYKRRTA